MLQTAIVGCGGIGKRHGDCYQADERTAVAAVCDLDEGLANEAAERYGCPAFTSVDELVRAGPRLDAASVCTAGEENGSHHYEPVMALLRADVPVLCEKPISNRLPEAEEMVATARERGVPLAVNLNHRFTPAADRARQWLDEGHLGALNTVQMRMWINNPNDSSPYFHIRALHPHSLDVMRHFGGDMRRVHAFFKKGEGRESWSNLQMNIEFANGVLGHLHGSYDGGGPGSPWGLETCEVIGQDAKATIHEACEGLEFQPRRSIEGSFYRHPGGMKSFGETFASRIDAWVADLTAGAAPDRIRGSGAEALQAQRVIEAAITSWEESRIVSVDEVAAAAA